MEPTRPQPGSNVLVQSPALGEAKRETCQRFLTAEQAEAVDVLRVSYSTTPAELVAEWRDAHGRLPARMCVVDVGENTGLTGDSGPDLPDAVSVAAANPNDVTGLGMRLNTYLTERQSDRPLLVCFDSLTEMLQFADTQTVFKFLHMFAGQLRGVGAAAHFHLDPAAHDTQTVSRLKPLFDDAVDRT